MNDGTHRNFAVALTAFALLSAAVNAGVAHVYTRGVEQLRSTHSIAERDLRVLARPLLLKVGQHFDRTRLIEHLDRIGYYYAPAAEPGCYDVTDDSVTIRARYPELTDVAVRWKDGVIESLVAPSGDSIEIATIEPQTIVTYMNDAAGSLSRTHLHPVPYSAVKDTALSDAVVASEDGLFEAHHGVDFVRLAAAPVMGGGASTISMQVARLNVLQDRSRTLNRKAGEIGVAMAMERRYSKEAILTAYLNTVDLGASRGRPVHGFGAAAREYLDVRDVRELTPIQAATLAALLNQPSRYLDEMHAGSDSRLRRQRNRVIALMGERFPDRYPGEWVRGAEQQPVVLARPTMHDDTLGKISRDVLDYTRSEMTGDTPSRVYLTLDADLQQIGTAAVEQGLTALDARMSARARGRVQAALLAIDPATGEILAMVGGRDYESSQFNRTISARRQVGSIMKPFTYLAAFERAGREGAKGISPDTIVIDRPQTFVFSGFAPWRPSNYENKYAGPITWRQALAESRNVSAVKVAAWAGFRNIAALWQSASGQSTTRIFPSIALGAFQATPFEVATAYSAFANDGLVRPLTAIKSVIAGGHTRSFPTPEPRRVAEAKAIAAVRDMMSTVMDHGTGRGARAAGFLQPAAGKTGTTDNLRDAWFAGFTNDVLVVVWVGRDDDRPLGFTGAQAALPIWTEFMIRAYQLRS